jgi:hypothetical protein
MTDDRHNIAALNDGADFPPPFDATATDLGRVIKALANIRHDLIAPVVTEELRLAQYRRAAEFGRWIVDAADDLAAALQTELDRRNGDAK